MKVFINPGHAPGIDPGAIGTFGTQEANVAAIIGKAVKRYLEEAGQEVALLQDDSLEKVCEESNRFGADFFVSIHCNSFCSPTANGFEVWVNRSPSILAQKLAACIEHQVVCTFPDLFDRGIKQGGLYVTKYTDAPACLVECAFISNPTEEAWLSDPDWQDEMARAIARGITDAML